MAQLVPSEKDSVATAVSGGEALGAPGSGSIAATIRASGGLMRASGGLMRASGGLAMSDGVWRSSSGMSRPSVAIDIDGTRTPPKQFSGNVERRRKMQMTPSGMGWSLAEGGSAAPTSAKPPRPVRDPRALRNVGDEEEEEEEEEMVLLEDEEEEEVVLLQDHTPNTTLGEDWASHDDGLSPLREPTTRDSPAGAVDGEGSNRQPDAIKSQAVRPRTRPALNARSWKGWNPTGPERFILSRIPDHWNCSGLLLVLLGAVTAGFVCLIDITIDEMTKLRLGMYNSTDIEFFRWCAWVSFPMIVLFIAVFSTRKIAVAAAGSGIPEMKMILSGVHLTHYLGFPTLVAKCIGLPLAVGSGAAYGKEGLGSFGSIIARQLSRFGLFHRVRDNHNIMIQMLAAGVACGVGSNFGSPVGGVLFAIEVTATYYPVRNYWSSFVASSTGALIFRYFFNSYFKEKPGFKAIMQTRFNSDLVNYGLIEILVFVTMGVIFGLMGIAFIRLNLWFGRTWNWWRLEYVPKLNPRLSPLGSPYFYPLFVGFVNGVVGYPGMIGSFMGMSSFKACVDLFLPCSLSKGLAQEGDGDILCTEEEVTAKDWDTRTPFLLSLFLFGSTRFLLTPFSMVVQLPSGLVVPILAAGAALGRLVGELVDLSFPQEGNAAYLLAGGGRITAGGYAVAGAAAAVAGITHTLSSAVILFELTGQIHYLIPTLITVVVAVAVAKTFSSLSMFDASARARGLPLLPDMQQFSYDIVAGDIMDKNISKFLVTSAFLIEDVTKVATDNDAFGGYVAVVSDKKERIVIGQVDRSELRNCLDKFFAATTTAQALMADASASEIASVARSQRQLPRMFRPHIRSAVQVAENTSMSDIHILLLTMHLDEIYVAEAGRMVGVVTRDAVKQILTKRDAVMTFLGE